MSKSNFARDRPEAVRDTPGRDRIRMRGRKAQSKEDTVRSGERKAQSEEGEIRSGGRKAQPEEAAPSDKKKTSGRKRKETSKARLGPGAAKRQRRGYRSRKMSGRMDYAVYRFSPMELIGYSAAYVLLDGCISFLFFRSLRAFVLLLPGALLFFREQGKNLQKKRKKELTGQFLDGIQLMLAALQAGYSPENALREACGELEKMYSSDALIVREFRQMDVQMRMSRSLEDLLLDFGRRSGISDILSFAEVFLTAKRTGGDLIAIIRNTVSCIRQKQETMQEIETTLAGKVMEQNIMSVIPILILVYVDLSSPGFLDVMYESATGVAVMGLCFGVYLVAYFWGQSIVRIEV